MRLKVELTLNAKSKSMRSAELRVAVVQDGARLHYAVPRALARAGALERVFCDWYAPPGSVQALVARVVEVLNADSGRKMAERHHPELSAAQVVQSLGLTLTQRLGRPWFGRNEQFFEWSSEAVGRWVLRSGFGNSSVLFGFVRNISPRLCNAARASGLALVVDQMIAPIAEEERQERLLRSRFPDWSATSEMFTATRVAEIEAETWAAAQRITCASEYVADKLVEQGIEQNRISVIPYPIDIDAYPFVDRTKHRGAPVVGFVGGIGLRKGAPYFLEVAKRFKKSDARFVMVGPVHVSETARRLLGEHVELVGPVARSEVKRWLEGFDVFLFPSTCEGSAGAVMEAMAAGLPVVTTPNSGSVVRHGVDGFIYPHDDIDRLAVAVETLVSDPDRRRQMGASARDRAAQIDLKTYGDALVRACFAALEVAKERCSP